MMFTPSRYVVIDDNETELRALVDALHELGAPCVGVLYDAEKDVRPELLAGVRVLFLDLHLIEGVQIGQQQKAYDVILQLLDNGIGAVSGPYVIVLWTSHGEQRDEFEKHMTDRLAPEKRPLAVLKLDKKDYLNAGGKADAEKLKNDVTVAVSTDPRLHALLNWERNVLAAAGETLSAIGALIPTDDRTPDRYGDQLDRILSVLSSAAAGSGRAANDVGAAANAALAPLLMDRILNQPADDEGEKVWKEAVTKIGDNPQLELPEAARLNTMLHAALPPAEDIRATDWGAVVRLPEAALGDGAMEARFALSKGKLMSTACPAQKKAGRKKCTPVLVRLGASCDYAQNRTGPIPYIFGVIVPVDVELMLPEKRSKAQVESPFLELPDFGVVRLFIDARYQISLVPADVEGWVAVCRLREQLVMQIAAHCAEYATRPGIVSIRPAEPTDLDEPEPEERAAKV